MIVLQLTSIDGSPHLWNELGSIDGSTEFVGDLKASTMVLPSDHSSDSVFAKQTIQTIELNYDSIVDLYHMVENGADNLMVISDSVVWYVQVLKLAFAIVERESYLPSLVKKGQYWYARWVALVDDDYSTIIDQLTLSMPEIVRCSVGHDGIEPNISRKNITITSLQYFLDLYLRNVNEELEPLDIYDSLHEAWLDALDSENPIIKWANEHEIQLFASQLATWRTPLDTQFNSKYKLCFRLSDPVESQQMWKLEFMLSIKDDPSTLLSVADLWNSESEQSLYLASRGGIPWEYILTALGQAAGICPFIQYNLKNKNPGSCVLDIDSTIKFLKNHASTLNTAGFKLILPAWWTMSDSSRRIALNINAKSSPMGGSGELNLNALLDYDYTIALGDKKISVEEIEALAKLKQPLVKLQGQWVMIDHKEIAAALRFIKSNKDMNLAASELLKASLGSHLEVDGLMVNSVDMSGWLKSVFNKLKGNEKFELLEQPVNLQGQLREYQNYGFSWLSFLCKYGFGACLADDMGLGKTVQALTFILKEYNAGEKRPVLLICPTSVVNNWRREAEKFCPELPVLIHHGTDRLRTKEFQNNANKHALVVSSFGLLQRDIDFLRDQCWAGVILDEAQNIKNYRSKQAQAARLIKADYRIALTGTPVENHVGDLWALMEFLNPGLLGSQSSFKANFYRTIQFEGDEKAISTLKSLTSPFILRRMKTDKEIIKDLPKKIEAKEYCTLTKEQVALYQSLVNEMQGKVESSEGISRQGMVLSLLMKLKQICNHPAQFLADRSELDRRSGKLQRLLEMLTEIREMGEKVLIFSQFAQMGTLLQNYLQNYFGEEVFFLHGSVSKKKRDTMVDRFQNGSNGPQIFILSLKAGGTGLNLTSANHVIHYDRWWNPAVENQATDRVFRIGQKKNVQVYKFIVSGTLEERIDDMIEKKIGVANMIIDTGEKWLGELSNDELRKIIQLSDDVTGE